MRQRAGYTLVELVVSAGLASLLMGGLASAVFVASSSLSATTASAPSHSRTAHALAQFADDARHARRVLALADRSASWELPDRDGDGAPEVVRYAWSGIPGDPLQYELNSRGTIALLDAVSTFRLHSVQRALPSETLFVPQVVYAGFAASNATNTATSTTVPRPTGVEAGDLVLLAFVCDEQPGSVASNVDWTGLAAAEGPDASVTLVVGWRLAAANEPAQYELSWANNEKHYAWAMRFTGHDPALPIGGVETNAGYAQWQQGGYRAATPNVTPTVVNSRIVRIGAFDGNPAWINAPGIDRHETITLNGSSGSGGVQGGAAHAERFEPVAGGGSYSFRPHSWCRFAAVTVALSPRLTP